MRSQSWTDGLAEYRSLCVDTVRLPVDIYICALLCSCRKVGFPGALTVSVKIAVYD